MNKRLYRSSSDKMLAGVAAGLAEYFSIDPVLTRVGFVVLFLSGGFGILAYIVLWIVVPYDYEIGIRKDFAEHHGSSDKRDSNSEQKNYSYSEFGSNDVHNIEVKDKNENMKKVAAVILILIGSLLLVDNLIIDVVFDNIGPALLVLAGILILIFARKNKKEAL